MNKLNDAEMDMTAGGNYGDKGNQGICYPQGTYVEVYDNFFHTTTTRARVIDSHTVIVETYKPNLWTGEEYVSDVECVREYLLDFGPEHKNKNDWYNNSDIQR